MNNDERILQILDRSACLSKGQMVAYLKGTLVPEELRAVELHLAECELCNDAIEGFRTSAHPEELISQVEPPVLPASETEKKSVTANVSRYAKTSATTTEEPTRVSTPQAGERLMSRGRKRRKSPLSGAIGIAALLLAGILAIWFFEVRNNDSSPDRQLADQIADKSDLDSAFSTPDNPQTIAAAKMPVENTNNGASQFPKADSGQKASSDDHYLADTVVAAMTARSPVASLSSDSPSARNRKDALALGARPGSDSDQPARNAVATEAPVPKKQQSTRETTEEVKTPEKKSSPTTKSAGNHSDYETGVALYKKKEYASALLYLNTVASDKDNSRYWDAVYYSALCNLQLGKEGRAKRYLKRVAKSSSTLKNAAEQQLNAMEKE